MGILLEPLPFPYEPFPYNLDILNERTSIIRCCTDVEWGRSALIQNLTRLPTISKPEVRIVASTRMLRRMSGYADEARAAPSERDARARALAAAYFIDHPTTW